jgi:hypothetical protein
MSILQIHNRAQKLIVKEIPWAYTISEPSVMVSLGRSKMGINRHISSALVMAFVLLLSTSLPAVAESRSLSPNTALLFSLRSTLSANIETIGVVVNGSNRFAANEPSCTVLSSER